MRECEWNPKDFNVETQMPQILCLDNQDSLLTAIKNDKIYGFVVCDVQTPVDLQSEYLNGHLFPPVIKRMVLEEKHLSPYMKKRFNARNKKVNQETVVQVKTKNDFFFQIFMLSASTRNRFC